jgi:cation-transporting ATPase E
VQSSAHQWAGLATWHGPGALTISTLSLAIYLTYLGTTGSLPIAQSALTTVTVLCGLGLVISVEPPTPAWSGGDEFSGDWRPTLLAGAMPGLYGAVLAAPPLRAFFELTPLAPLDYLLLGSAVLI